MVDKWDTDERGESIDERRENQDEQFKRGDNQAQRLNSIHQKPLFTYMLHTSSIYNVTNNPSKQLLH